MVDAPHLLRTGYRTADDIADKEHKLEMKYFPEIVEKVIRAQLHVDETSTT